MKKIISFLYHDDYCYKHEHSHLTISLTFLPRERVAKAGETDDDGADDEEDDSQAGQKLRRGRLILGALLGLHRVAVCGTESCICT